MRSKSFGYITLLYHCIRRCTCRVLGAYLANRWTFRVDSQRFTNLYTRLLPTFVCTSAFVGTAYRDSKAVWYTTIATLICQLK